MAALGAQGVCTLGNVEDPLHKYFADSLAGDGISNISY